jgi:lysozyme family protein
MADFNKYISFNTQWEGGYVNNPSDKGGPTNRGVTFNTFKSFAKSMFNIEPTLENLKKLTVLQAQQVMKWYWDTCKANNINNQAVAEYIVDWFWGSGYTALEWVNGVMKKYFSYSMPSNAKELSIDTIQKINNVDSTKLANYLHQERTIFLQGLVKKNKTQEQFYAGWINRINDLYQKNAQYIEKTGIGILGIIAIIATLVVGRKIIKKEL